MILWRPMRGDDLPAVLRIAETLHPDYPERIEVFADKLAFFPAGCRVVEDADGAIRGYAFAHVWSQGLPPLLDQPLGPLPGPADCLHLHDIALMPQIRGHGGATLYLNQLEALAQARGLPALTLIAIKGQDGFWRGLGFKEFIAPTAELTARLGSYGSGNSYLCRDVTKLKESDTQTA
ncbi:GNAT family N-acetyltransferase [Magnetospirillum sulfuroxidans]|uniref:GNAT family N-acetyltransferase n=1 Tax=Magnetospirillum sulfuroxidans TaxID=611300 RepID=A0ABS5I7X2_9PROT|nr:GNAT family N-acetyltransferase [Magnetospirillum sulfuroxidans]MBR9970351.1 GNAT family N-acetyltransferase [Magnetospirillum sulfuroxidans]